MSAARHLKVHHEDDDEEGESEDEHSHEHHAEPPFVVKFKGFNAFEAAFALVACVLCAIWGVSSASESFHNLYEFGLAICLCGFVGVLFYEFSIHEGSRVEAVLTLVAIGLTALRGRLDPNDANSWTAVVFATLFIYNIAFERGGHAH